MFFVLQESTQPAHEIHRVCTVPPGVREITLPETIMEVDGMTLERKCSSALYDVQSTYLSPQTGDCPLPCLLEGYMCCFFLSVVYHMQLQ